MQLIKKFHYGQLCRNGYHLYHHLLETADIAFGYASQEDVLVVALLHHILDCPRISIGHIQGLFGNDLAEMVKAINNLNGHSFNKYKIKKYAYYNNLAGLLDQMNKKILYAKLADRLHTMRTLDDRSTVTNKKIAEEVLLYFVPIAKSLALHAIADELYSRCCIILNN